MSLSNFFGKSFFKEFSFFGSSTILIQVSRVIVEIIIAKIVGPKIWGVWYLLNLFIAYRGVLTLGIDNGMNREVPVRIGAGLEEDARDLQNSTFTALFYASLLVSAGLLLLFFYADNAISVYIPALILLFCSAQFYHFLSIVLKSNSRFNLVSKKQYFASILLPIISIYLTRLIGLNGFIIGYALALLVSSLYVYKLSGIRLRVVNHWKTNFYLIKIGFPIMAVGITYTFLNTLDRWLIEVYYGTEALGLYSLSIMIFAAMTLFPKIISQQIYPRMAQLWGKSRSLKKLKYLCYKQSVYTAYLVIPVFIIAFLFIKPLVSWILPEYIGGIRSAQIIVFGSIPMIFSAGWGSVLNILDRQVYYLIIIVFGLILNLGFNLFFIKLGFGIEGIALGTLLAFSIYNLLIMFAGILITRRVQ